MLQAYFVLSLHKFEIHGTAVAMDLFYPVDQDESLAVSGPEVDPEDHPDLARSTREPGGRNETVLVEGDVERVCPLSFTWSYKEIMQEIGIYLPILQVSLFSLLLKIH